MQMLTIMVPDELVDTSTPKQLLEAVAHEALIVRLYHLGEISSGKAAEVLKISRRAFLDLLTDYGVSEFDDDIDLVAEARIATEVRLDR